MCHYKFELKVVDHLQFQHHNLLLIFFTGLQCISILYQLLLLLQGGKREPAFFFFFYILMATTQKMQFSNKDFFSKCDQIRRKLQILSHLLTKSLMENFIFCAVGLVITKSKVNIG